jgi:hypothetical protein
MLRILVALAVVPLVACSTPDFHARAINGPGVRNGDELLAEGRMQFRNGNFALAVDAFRRATRQPAQSVDAYNGLAASYDRLGRFDLARRYYEEALAIAPADPRVIHNYAVSLRLQGRDAEAHQLLASASPPAAASPVPAAQEAALADAVASPMTGDAPVASQLAALEPPAEPAAAAPAPIPQPAAPQPVVAAPPSLQRAAVPTPPPIVAPSRRTVPRLERISMGEVALITRPEAMMSGANGFRRANSAPQTKGAVVQLVGQVAQAAGARSQPRSPAEAAGAPAMRILNAVGVRGQAGRMERHVRALGWERTSIGDASSRRAASVIIAPPASLAAAEALAGRLPFRPRVVSREGTPQILLVLGRDAVSFDRQLGRVASRT